MARGPARAAVALFALCCAAGCQRPPDTASLAARLEEAERLCLDAKFEEARAQLRGLLLDDPENAGAHFYLGRSYLTSVPALAEGEYQTALRLFADQGRVSPTPRLSAEYFELMCYVDSAKATWLEGNLALATPGVHGAAVRTPLERGFEYLTTARKLNATATEIDEVAALLRDLAEAHVQRRR